MTRVYWDGVPISYIITIPYQKSPPLPPLVYASSSTWNNVAYINIIFFQKRTILFIERTYVAYTCIIYARAVRRRKENTNNKSIWVSDRIATTPRVFGVREFFYKLLSPCNARRIRDAGLTFPIFRSSPFLERSRPKSTEDGTRNRTRSTTYRRTRDRRDISNIRPSAASTVRRGGFKTAPWSARTAG